MKKHCENIINELVNWLEGAKSIQWYEYDIYKHDEMDENYLMLRSMLFLSFGFNTKFHDILINGTNCYQYGYELKDTINNFERTFVISYIKNSKVTDFNYKIIKLFGKEVFQIIFYITKENIDNYEYRLYSKIRNVIKNDSNFSRIGVFDERK